MKVKDVKICLNCDGVFSAGTVCPYCASQNFHYLSRWIPSLRWELDNASDASRPAQFKEPWFWRLPFVRRCFKPIDVAF